jgi:plastocyanin
MDIAQRRLLPAVASFLFVLTACSGSATASSTPPSASDAPSASSEPSDAGVQMTSETADQAPAGAIVIAAGPGSRFTPTEIETAAAETLTFFIDMSTAAGYFHNFNIGLELPPAPALATTTAIFEPDESVVVRVSGLEPGTYQYWCSYLEHYKYGMHGTLTVR